LDEAKRLPLEYPPGEAYWDFALSWNGTRFAATRVIEASDVYALDLPPR
jgi:hypothetical protein